MRCGKGFRGIRGSRGVMQPGDALIVEKTRGAKRQDMRARGNGWGFRGGSSECFWGLRIFLRKALA